MCAFVKRVEGAEGARNVDHEALFDDATTTAHPRNHASGPTTKNLAMLVAQCATPAAVEVQLGVMETRGEAGQPVRFGPTHSLPAVCWPRVRVCGLPFGGVPVHVDVASRCRRMSSDLPLHLCLQGVFAQKARFTCFCVRLMRSDVLCVRFMCF